jgi:hypothetical protein
MQHEFFDVSNEQLNKKEKANLVSFVYGNENNFNNFPASSFTKSKKDMYSEMGEVQSIANIITSNRYTLDNQRAI